MSKRLHKGDGASISSSSSSSTATTTMDPQLWGTLRNHIDMEYQIYARVPYRQFTQLRLVCRDWNRLAGDRHFLEASSKDKLVEEPYFILNHQCVSYSSTGARRLLPKFLQGLVSFDATSGRWNWTRLPLVRSGIKEYFDGSFVLEGFVYNEKVRMSYKKKNGEHAGFKPYTASKAQLNALILPGDIQRIQTVFNVHTKAWHRLPPPLKSTTSLCPVVGMLVDTAAHPFEFKLIQASRDLKTQIYDSKTNSWELQGSRITKAMSRFERVDFCATLDGLLYMKDSKEHDILAYDINLDLWSVLREPLSGGCDSFDCIGTWHDRRQTPGRDRLMGYKTCYDLRTVSVALWELVDAPNHKWKKYSQMPSKLFSWLYYLGQYDGNLKVQPYACFCNSYVVVYSLICSEAEAKRFAVFDLATKLWRAHLPFGEFGLYNELDSEVDYGVSSESCIVGDLEGSDEEDNGSDPRDREVLRTVMVTVEPELRV